MNPNVQRLLRIALQAGLLLGAFLLGATIYGNRSAPPASTGAAAEVWTCSMHPQIRQPEFGACPLCGMDLIVAGPGGTQAADQVVLSERARTLAQLRTAVVRRQSDATARVRLLGKLEPAESTRRNVTTWVGGRIDRLHVNTTGERVRKGQVIATLYSPEVYSAHQDLLTAQAQVGRLASSPPAAQQAAQGALDAARERLRLLGLPDTELQALAEASEPTRAIAIRSPFSGTVIERAATEGAYVQTGATLYRVANLGKLWVQLDAYESDLPHISTGQTVELSVEALPGERFEGRVAFVDPTLDPKKRTAQVRVEVDNPDGRLRPGMFAEASVSAAGSDNEPLVIPSTAPLFTGRRSVVYVELESAEGERAYAPRTVRLGPRLGDVYPVVSGLSEGERVVSRGAFVLDADLQIRGGDSMMTQPDDDAPDLLPVQLSAAQRDTFAPILVHYLAVQRALAADDHEATTAAASELEGAVRDLEPPKPAQDEWPTIATPLTARAHAISGSADLSAARGEFEPLSAAIEHLLMRFGNPLSKPVNVAFCPMAMGNEGARWVQQGDTIDNAYFGAMMRTCGEIRGQVAPDTYLSTPSAPPMRADPHEGHQH